jgi:hypothetical protein
MPSNSILLALAVGFALGMWGPALFAKIMTWREDKEPDYVVKSRLKLHEIIARPAAKTPLIPTQEGRHRFTAEEKN